MRRISVLLAAAVISSGLVALFAAPSANAQCPGEDGTVPGSSASTTTLGPDDGSNGNTIFVDDRDFLDVDDDGDAGGLWVYIEDNETPGLTRGGDNFIFNQGFNPPVPFIPPVVILPPDPNRPVAPNGITLFPNGIGGGSLSDLAGAHDDCIEFDSDPNTPAPAKADSILF